MGWVTGSDLRLDLDSVQVKFLGTVRVSERTSTKMQKYQ
jgi:hypothetical protein